MPSALRIQRTRRQRRQSSPALRGRVLGVLAVALSVAALGGLFVGSTFLGLAAELPEVGRMEAQFGLRGAESFRPVLLYDRTGTVVLFQNLHPAASSRVWVDPPELPLHVVQATVVALDPTFWTNPGYELRGLADTADATIAQRLTAAALLPPAAQGASPATRAFQNSLLAAELTKRYPKERILAWFLNSVDYGHAAYGIDAAALVYFGKHAFELNLAESAMLAALALNPELDPVGGPHEVKLKQAEVLEAMVAAGSLPRADAEQARRQALELQSSSLVWQPPEFARYAFKLVEAVLGPSALARSGLRVISSLDHDLQQQATCAAESHVERLRGESAGTVVRALDGIPCVSAALLPTLRPSDAGLDHQVESSALIVLDPQRGEILAASGSILQLQPGGPALSPFVYLTAFSRGRSPSSMVLDIGPSPEESYGPVRMRTALASLLPGAEASLLIALGEDSIHRTLSQLGLRLQPGEDGELREEQVGVLDMARTYGVLAAGGRGLGIDLNNGTIAPTIVLRVEEAGGTRLFEYSPAERAIVSPQLAFLLVNVLSDEPARWPSLGQPNLLEIGRPAAALSGNSPEMQTNWAVGFTPQRVVAVWLAGSPLQGVDRLNGAATIWHAVTRFALAGLPTQGWQVPPGLAELEVCDPSGLLPTAYCPEVVREFFIQGSEPTHYDNLYQPFRINAETGKLATLFTPLASIEERVFFIPPLEAQEWARAVGLEQPPEVYDTLPSAPSFPTGARIVSPAPFGILGAEVSVLGDASSEDFRYYRLQYGQGLNPARWIQIGEDQQDQVENGRLGVWSTDGLNGLYTLQLLVILQDGQVRTAATPVTLDNQPPLVQILSPEQGQEFRLGSQPSVLLQADASDEVKLERVEFLVNGRRVGTVTTGPFRFSWTLPTRTGAYEVLVRASDAAGNQAESQPVAIEIVP